MWFAVPHSALHFLIGCALSLIISKRWVRIGRNMPGFFGQWGGLRRLPLESEVLQPMILRGTSHAFGKAMMPKVTEFALATLIAAIGSGCALSTASEEDIGMVTSAVKDESKAAEKDEAKADKAAEKAERKAARLEGFEEQPAGTSPEEFQWFTKGASSYYTVTDEEAFRGKQSMRLVSPSDPKHRDARIGAKVCAGVGSETLTVSFRARLSGDDPYGWSHFSISGDPDLAAQWWILPDGTVTDRRNTYGKIAKNTWTRIRVVVDLPNDLATVSIDGVSVATQISTTWKLFEKPIECLRLAAAWQTLAVDQIRIQPEGLVP